MGKEDGCGVSDERKSTLGAFRTVLIRSTNAKHCLFSMLYLFLATCLADGFMRDDYLLSARIMTSSSAVTDYKYLRFRSQISNLRSLLALFHPHVMSLATTARHLPPNVEDM